MGFPKKIAKKIIQEATWKRMHLLQNNKAKVVLRKIEKRKGKLSVQLIDECDEYAQDVLGDKVYAPWLYVYSAVQGEFKEGWLPNNYYDRYVVPMVAGAYGDVSFLKPFSRNLFHSELFPDIGCYVNGLWFTKNLEVISEDQVADYLFRFGDKIVYKCDENCFQGLGVHFFQKDTFSVQKIKLEGNGLFQEYIRQHDLFNQMMPDSVATLRITTVVDKFGLISPRTSFLRVARKAETHINSRTELGINVDIKTGELSKDIYAEAYRILRYHPDTNFDFEGKYIPFFDKCVEEVSKLHRMVPQVRCIGWDLSIDNSGNVKIMEWNGSHTDIEFSEATVGPCFADLGWDKLHLVKEKPELTF